MTVDILAIVFLSTFVEGFVKYLLDVLGKTMPKKKLEKVSNYTQFVALGLGVVLAVAYEIDLPAMLFGLTSNYGLVNYIISGIVIGRGSNYLNDVISKVRDTSKSG